MSKSIQPNVDFRQRLCIDRVDASCALGANRREAALTQDLELLRDLRLCDAELTLDDFDDLTGRVFAVGEEFQDAPPNGIAEDFEGVHQAPV
jgi:hypothetical protein